MIEYIALLLVIYGWTTFLVINKREINPYAFVASCSLIIITLFVFSIFQSLRIGLLAVLGIGALGIVFSVKNIATSSKLRAIAFHRFFSLAIICVLAFLASWGADYWAWDEFSHWGAQVEYLLLNGNLHTDSKLLLFPEYIPGISLWRYFGRVSLKSAGASGSYFISFVLIFSCIYAVSYARSISKWLITGLIVFLGLLVFFQTLVNALLVDPVQSLLLLCALKIASDDNSSDFVYLILVTVVVVLTKHVGLIFSFFIACYYLFIHLFAYKNTSSVVFRKASLIFISALISYVIWLGYLNYYAISKSVIDSSKFFDGNISDSLVRFWINISGVLDSRFPHALFVKPTIRIDAISHGIALWEFTLVILIFGLILAYLPGQNRKISWINFIYLLVACFLYLLFLAFIRASTPWGGDPYSFSRYFCVVLFPFFFLQILVAVNRSFARVVVVGLMFIVFFLLVSPPFNTVFSLKKRPEILINNEYNKKALFVKKHANFDSTVWYINSNNDMAYFVFRMKMLPMKVLDHSLGWSLYLNDSLQKMDGIKNRVEIFSQLLCKADFVFVDDVSSEFWKQYLELFGGGNSQLFKVRKGIDNKCFADVLE